MNKHAGFAYQSKEFVGAGLSPENILSFRDWIGSEEIRFVDYHIRDQRQIIQVELNNYIIVYCRILLSFPIFKNKFYKNKDGCFENCCYNY